VTGTKSEVKLEVTSLASLDASQVQKKNTAALKQLSTKIRIFLKIAPVWQNEKPFTNG
jgi:hypothetical protein